MKTSPIVSPEEWRTAREQLLVKEKEHKRPRRASRPASGIAPDAVQGRSAGRRFAHSVQRLVSRDLWDSHGRYDDRR